MTTKKVTVKKDKKDAKLMPTKSAQLSAEKPRRTEREEKVARSTMMMIVDVDMMMMIMVTVMTMTTPTYLGNSSTMKMVTKDSETVVKTMTVDGKEAMMLKEPVVTPTTKDITKYFCA
jgi:hypothetical protein